MKIINTTRPVSLTELKQFLDEKLNPLFQKQRQLELAFDTRINDEGVEIYNTGLYDGFLFRFEIKGTEMNVIKSEHYTDDVNVLTLEDILNNLFLEFPGRDQIKYIGEES
ncbi:hypothetical protein [Mucilaginibacter sp. KACC 22063]|uniref:hypothetical protein n=1 Tax=Mucilaginibacter sp. KACC 22063 TaxID=3025666 RepID=UPI002365B2DB|nr:hypothetical protein [Mucilaginibacter sp. KACC 22063]WDF56342.1 hypothetical protein PQ461_04635 [Mucilaginibacter sp. KACC 22063]